jgi:hypothetical protein
MMPTHRSKLAFVTLLLLAATIAAGPASATVANAGTSTRAAGTTAPNGTPTAAPTSSPTPAPTSTAEPTPTPDPELPQPDPSQTYVSAWAVIRNPTPANGEPWLLLSGWRFAATFEDATVLRSHPVTRITEENADSAWWQIEFSGAGPARATVTVVPEAGARLLDVQCAHHLELDFDKEPFAAARDGNTVSFEVMRGTEYSREYECNFIVDPATVPQTDTGSVTSRVASSAGWLAVLPVLAGTAIGLAMLAWPRPSRIRRQRSDNAA